jgi:hypothetical protein
MRRRLITARLAEALVLGSINGLGLLEDLARDLLVVAVGIAARVRRHLCSVDRDHASAHQPGLGA